MKKQFLINIFIIFFLFFGIFLSLIFKKSTPTLAGSGDNVYYFAWGGFPELEGGVLKTGSGWLKFNNCLDPSNLTTCGSVGYGVNINSDLKLSGYAWSGGGVDINGNDVPVFRWLSFNRNETGSPPSNDVCPDGSCLAKIADIDPLICDRDNNGKLDINCGGDNSTNLIGDFKQIFGWARFLSACDANNDGTFGDCQSGPCSNCGGWDGWVKFSHQSLVSSSRNYGVVIDKTKNPREFRGWAWGSDVVGWISFNGVNFLGGADYKVLTSFQFNSKPVVNFWCCPDGCNNCLSEGPCEGYVGIFCLKNKSHDPDNNIQNSIWRIIQTNHVSNCLTISGNPLCDLTPNLPTSHLTPITYTAELTVTDTDNLSNVLYKNFNLLQDIKASFECSLSSTGPWSDCNGFKVNINQEIYLRDTSTQSTGATINSWNWTFPAGWQHATTSNSSIPNPFGYFTSSGEKEINLCVTDTKMRSDCARAVLNIRRLPIWFPGAP